MSGSTFGGTAEETVTVTGPIIIVAQGGTVATDKSAAPIDTVGAAPVTSLHVVETRPATRAAVDLTKAKRIVAAGRGLKSKDRLAMIEELATALGAEMACSRPYSCRPPVVQPRPGRGGTG